MFKYLNELLFIYYYWMNFQDFSDYENFDECLAYIEDCMIKQGPFDGLLGFSQVCVSLCVCVFCSFFFFVCVEILRFWIFVYSISFVGLKSRICILIWSDNHSYCMIKHGASVAATF